MKKILLTFCAIGLSLFANAQVFVDENVSALTVGNVGTDLTGATPGQGGWTTIVAAGGNNSDFQVIDNGDARGNVFQITGSNTTANNRRLVKDIAVDWAFREAGNVAEVEFDFFTGPATTSANNMRVLLYDATLTKMLGGIMVYMSTLELRGLGYYDATAQAGGVLGNYSFRLSYTATPTPTYADVFLERNTWYKLGFSYNYTTGELIFKEGSGLITSPPVIGAAAGTDVSIMNVSMNAISTSATQPNTISAIGLFDNLICKASATSDPLAVHSNAVASNEFAVFPNPAQQVINIRSNASILKISLTDLNGRVVKESAFDKMSDIEWNISDLTSGLYLMNITTAEGNTVKKIMKN